MKKILSTLFVFVMVICFSPTNIYAADDTLCFENTTLTIYEELKTELNNISVETKALKTEDSINIIEVVSLLVFSLVVFLLVKKWV